MAEEKEKSGIHTAHDRFVKDFMHDLADAADVLKAALPSSLAERLPWEDLKQESAEFINEHLDLRHSDLLFSIPYRETRLRLFLLFEHQSSPERDAALRASEYKNACYRHQQKQREPLGPAQCLILYHGKEAWSVAENFPGWLKLTSENASELHLSELQKEYLLLDISKLNVEALAARVSTKARLALLKSLREGTELEWFLHYASFVDEWLKQPGESMRVRTMLRYCLQASSLPVSTFQAELKKLPYVNSMNAFKSTADQFIEEGLSRGVILGREEGRQEGRQEGRMEGMLIGKIQLMERMAMQSPSPYEQLTTLSIEQLEERLAQLESILFGKNQG
ncbi:MAG: Rpn family recombination-promoting nuclease/putative transposase [Verrucomicrobiales bacterium]